MGHAEKARNKVVARSRVANPLSPAKLGISLVLIMTVIACNGADRVRIWLYEIAQPAPESSVTTPAQPAIGPLDRLREWQGMAEGAYSANTLRAQKADGAIFQAFCEGRGEAFLPADPNHPRVHRARSEGGQEAGDGAAVHRHDRASAHGGRVTQSLFRRGGAAGVKEDGPGDLGAAGSGARVGLEGDQGIHRKRGQGLRADRERAMLCIAYETLARRGELVALEVRDIEFWPNGTGQALIRRGKTDAEGQGRVAYLSRETVKWLKIWLEHAKIKEGADISAVDWSRSNRRRFESRQHRADLQTGGTVDWDAGEVCGGGEWALHAGRSRAGSRGTRYRLGGDHAGRWMEIDADAVAICREDQCGKVGNGEGCRSRWAQLVASPRRGF
jgi:hypothetical protein